MFENRTTKAKKDLENNGFHTLALHKGERSNSSSDRFSSPIHCRGSSMDPGDRVKEEEISMLLTNNSSHASEP